MRAREDKSDPPRNFDAGSQTPPEALLVGSVLFVTALVYAATLRFAFVYDDEEQIVQNALVHSWRFVPQYFQSSVWQYFYPGSLANYYRPLNMLWFRLNDAVFGLHPAGWHATAIGLHLLATFLAYQLARRLTGRPLVATLAALLFAMHPTRHEVVAWVSGTTESLWTVFFFAALLAYLKSREGRRVLWMAVSCLLYAAALLSKETAIVLPALVFAHAWIYGIRATGEEQPGHWQRFSAASLVMLAYAPLAILYVVVRIDVLHGFSHALVRSSLWWFALTLPSVLFFYLRQWLVPVQVSGFYDLSWQTHFTVLHVLAPLLAIVLVAAVVWFFRRALGTREVAFAVACIVIPLAPALDLTALPAGEMAHDRYFYVPGFGAALLVSLAFAKLARGKVVWRLPRRWLVATLVLLVLLSYDTANAASYWINDRVLFQHAYQIAPQDFNVRNNYANQLMLSGDIAGAMPIFQGLVKERPNNWSANFNMGRLFYSLKMYPAAEHYLEHARKIAPQFADTYLQLALVDLRTNYVAPAEANLRQAVALRPYEPVFHYALGTVLAREGNCSQARPQFAEALALNPEFPKAQKQMQSCKSDAASAQADPRPGEQDASSRAAPARGGQGGAGALPDPPRRAPEGKKPGG
jgi:protein O-mannosyl-transferase